MPLVRIDLVEGRSADQLRVLADVVQACMESAFSAPARDRYQIVTEHPRGRLFIEDTGLDLRRSEAVVVISITQQGRTDAQKQALYAALAEKLEHAAGVRPEDLVVSVTENTRADWSFGLGRAQFLTGEL